MTKIKGTKIKVNVTKSARNWQKIHYRKIKKWMRSVGDDAVKTTRSYIPPPTGVWNSNLVWSTGELKASIKRSRVVRNGGVFRMKFGAVKTPHTIVMVATHHEGKVIRAKTRRGMRFYLNRGDRKKIVAQIVKIKKKDFLYYGRQRAGNLLIGGVK